MLPRSNTGPSSLPDALTTCISPNRSGAPAVLIVSVSLGFALLISTCGEPTGVNDRVVSVSVSPDSALLVVSDSFIATAVARDAGGNVVVSAAVAWSSRDNRTATVNGRGLIKGIHSGRTSIIAKAGASMDSLVIVDRDRGTTTVSPHTDTLIFIGQGDQLRADTRDTSGLLAGAYAWVSRNPSVVTVTQTGRIVARGVGGTNVVALEDGGSRDSTRVVVVQRLARVAVAPSAVSRPVARLQLFSASPLDSGGTVVPGLKPIWSSAIPSVATIDSTGLATAVAPGVDTIRAQVKGVTGVAVLRVSPLPDLRFNLDTFRLGVGQYATSLSMPGGQPQLIADSAEPEESFFAHLVADTMIAAVPESLMVPEDLGLHHTDFTFAGRVAGQTVFTASAPRYAPAHAAIRVSTPRLRASGKGPGIPDTLGTNEVAAFPIYTADSLGFEHEVVKPVTIIVHSSDTSVIKPVSDSLVVVARDVGVNTSFAPTGLGNAWVRFQSSGYRPDSVPFVVLPARLRFWRPSVLRASPVTIGLGQATGVGYAYVATGSRAPPGTVTVLLHHSHPERVFIPTADTVQTVGAGGLAALEWSGLELGADTIVATAAGYTPDTLVVYVTTPTFRACTFPTTARADRPSYTGVVAADSTGASHYPLGPLQAVATSSDTAILTLVPDTVGVGGGDCAGGEDKIVYTGHGSATLTFTDPAGVYRALITPPITVTPVPVRFGLGPTLANHVTIGMRQVLSRDSVPFVTIPDHGGGTVWINLRSTSAAVRTSLSRFPIVATGLSFEIIGGDTTGTSWIVAEGPQVVSDSIEVEVGRPQFAIHGRQPPGGLDTLRAISLEVLDHYGNVRAPAEAITATISSSNFSILVADSATLIVPTSVQSSGVTSLRCLRPGTAVIRATDPRPEYYHYDTGSTGLLGCSP